MIPYIFQKLHLVEIVDACLLSSTDHCEQTTPVLCSLHRLLIEYKVQVKVSVLMQALHNIGPSYLRELLL